MQTSYLLAVAGAAILAVVASAQSCTPMGQRCIGAPGYPSVPYLGCCSGATCTGADPVYGKTCVAAGSYPTPVTTKPAGYTSAAKCTPMGQRCIGAPGYPPVPYLGCCSGKCTGTDSYYGKTCVA
jgi:hypothetical protein